MFVYFWPGRELTGLLSQPGLQRVLLSLLEGGRVLGRMTFEVPSSTNVLHIVMFFTWCRNLTVDLPLWFPPVTPKADFSLFTIIWYPCVHRQMDLLNLAKAPGTEEKFPAGGIWVSPITHRLPECQQGFHLRTKEKMVLTQLWRIHAPKDIYTF